MSFRVVDLGSLMLFQSLQTQIYKSGNLAKCKKKRVGIYKKNTCLYFGSKLN